MKIGSPFPPLGFLTTDPENELVLVGPLPRTLTVHLDSNNNWMASHGAMQEVAIISSSHA